MSAISATELISFPDPSKFGDINHTGKVSWVEDNQWLKADRSNGYIAGDIYEISGIQKLFPYQSREETLKLNVQGMSRAEDAVDFFGAFFWGALLGCAFCGPILTFVEHFCE